MAPITDFIGCLHLAVRVPLTSTVNGRRQNTVELHNEVARKMGKVAFAKFGQPGTVDRVRRLNNQIESGRETLLLLIIKEGARFLGFQAPILGVHLGPPKPEILGIAPPYYSTSYENPQLWFVVGSPFIESRLTKFRLLSNDRPLLDVVRESRTSSMLVHQES